MNRSLEQEAFRFWSFKIFLLFGHAWKFPVFIDANPKKKILSFIKIIIFLFPSLNEIWDIYLNQDILDLGLSARFSYFKLSPQRSVGNSLVN